ncbi:MAG: hypothetical protein KGI51_06455, partial [Rhodospirillales bacterium]|nr:hypothetical protein [Rhodospirillales bacterium]
HRYLFQGRPTGSATPLAWAHAEFVKLVISRHAGRAVDAPGAVARRYRARQRPAVRSVWTPWAAIGRMSAGTRLVVVLEQPALVRWSAGAVSGERATLRAGFGLHAAVLRTEAVPGGSSVALSWHMTDGTQGQARVLAEG